MLTVLSLFSGIGGIDFGLEATGGFRTVAFCEVDPFCRAVLAKHWPGVPIHEDVRRLTARDVPGVDAIVGGFPCQPHSVAGKRRGREDERHLWPEFARLVREIRPRWVLAENVPGLRTTAADEVLADLEAEGYACWPLVVGADDVGAPHRRKRVWIVAHRVGAALREQPGRVGGTRGPGAAESRGDGAALADSDAGRQPGKRSGGLLDGEREALGDDADGRVVGTVGEPERAGLQAGGKREAWWPDARRSHLGSPTGGGLAEPRRGDAGALAATAPQCWPARPGEPQHEWEEPRLMVYATGGPDGHGRSKVPDDLGPANRSGSRHPEQPLGGAVDGLPERLVRASERRARRANREALEAYGNSVVPQVVYEIGCAILEAEARMSAPNQLDAAGSARGRGSFAAAVGSSTKEGSVAGVSGVMARHPHVSRGR